MKKVLQRQYIYLLCVLLISWLIFLQLEIGDGYETIERIFEMETKYMLLNVITIYMLIFWLGVISNHLGIVSLICSTLFSFIAILNYHVIAYRGLPLTFLDVYNAGMAADIGRSYAVMVNEFTIKIFLLFIVELAVGIFIAIQERKNKICWRKMSVRNIVFFFGTIICVYAGYLAVNPIKPKVTIGWLWSEAYHKYGYLACSIENGSQMSNVVKEPKEYDESIIDNITVPKEQEKDELNPDIILILNETFCDLKEITDLKTDVDYLKNIHQMENLIQGQVVVPVAGGGTNKSEYELLTSNSMELMNTSSTDPFNILKLKNANSVVSILKQKGYQTLASHSEPGTNYSRSTAYPNLGFDIVHFQDDFNKEYYGDRWYATDESLYKSLTQWYETMGENPRFLYLLTVQNHGAWDMNPPERDLVHVIDGVSEDQKEKVNEYLSCIAMSDQAFKNLTDYYSKVNRPVIICMVGDHAPAFALELIDSKYNEMEAARRLRTVPFLVWSNFELKNAQEEMISMNYVVPTILKWSGINNLSYYYNYMLSMKKNLPIVSSYDAYIDVNNNIYRYEEESPYTNLINGYLYMEYNNLEKPRRQELFEVTQ